MSLMRVAGRHCGDGKAMQAMRTPFSGRDKEENLQHVSALRCAATRPSLSPADCNLFSGFSCALEDNLQLFAASLSHLPERGRMSCRSMRVAVSFRT